MSDLRERVALLPCPFCGGKAVDDTHSRRTGCPSCGIWVHRTTITAENGIGRSVEREAAAWNTRADAALAALAALAEMGGKPNWEGFGRDLLESWPVGDVDGADLFDAALRNGLIRDVPGGYDPEQHIDAECICPEKGDPWYEYAFGAAIEP